MNVQGGEKSHMLFKHTGPLAADGCQPSVGFFAMCLGCSSASKEALHTHVWALVPDVDILQRAAPCHRIWLSKH